MAAMNTKDKTVQWSLMKYRGTGSKLACPHCRCKSFKPYVDEAGVPFAEYYKDAAPNVRELAMTVGRCDHERTCAYNYPPREFYADTKLGITKHRDDWTPPPPKTTASPLPWDYVTLSKLPYHSNLVKYWHETLKIPCSLLDPVLEMYHVGATKEGRIIYWMIDEQGQCKDGKMMMYKADGHRYKDADCQNLPQYEQRLWSKPTWAYSNIIRLEPNPDIKAKLQEYEVIRPYFGTHLLSDPRFKDKQVGLVEGEKSALICSMFHPDMLWIAIGTKYFNAGKMQTAMFQHREIFLFPDRDGVEDKFDDKGKLISESWERRMKKEFGRYDNVFCQNDWILDHAEEPNDDIGDITLRAWQRQLDEVLTKVSEPINKLDLEIV